MAVKISVIIPTYYDWARLRICLDALEKQSIPSEQFEIIVSNNAPEDRLPEGYPLPANCRVIDVQKQGSYAARNCALRAAHGEIIAFTDSDCVPDLNWLDNALTVFTSNPRVDRIAGNIKLFYKAERRTLAEIYESVYAFRQEKASRDGVSVTGNLVVYKNLFDRIGGFNEELFSGGDYEWNKRATDSGSKIIYGAGVVVLHPARHSVKQLVKKEKRVAGWIGKKRKVAFFRLLKYTLPPINTLWKGEKLNIIQRLGVFMLKYYLNIVRSSEEVRIAFGKKANRE